MEKDAAGCRAFNRNFIVGVPTAALLYTALAVMTAVVLRQIGFFVNELLDLFCIILRSSIYIGLFAAWGISARNRIIQPQVRRCLTVP